ncbi:MAG: Uma2 family endonuclease [Gammaproteobacteria bacterium]
MSSPALDLYQRHRLTVHDFQRMGEAGILPIEGRLELIEGEIIAMAPIGSRHAAIVTRANMLFVQAVDGRAIVSVQNPILLGEHSEPEPDLALIQPREDFYALALPRADEVLLIVEVADTTLRYDREIKIPLYARHGIPEVWLIDVEGRTLTIFETPADGRYRDERRMRPSGTLAPKALPGVEVDLSRLFGMA